MNNSITQVIVDLIIGLISIIVGALILANVIKISEGLGLIIGLLLLALGLYYIYRAYNGYKLYKDNKNNDN